MMCVCCCTVRGLPVCQGDDEDSTVRSLRRVPQVLRQDDPDGHHRPLPAPALRRLSHQDPQTQTAAGAVGPRQARRQASRRPQIGSRRRHGPARTSSGPGRNRPALQIDSRCRRRWTADVQGTVLRPRGIPPRPGAGGGDRRVWNDPSAEADAPAADLSERSGRRAVAAGVRDGGRGDRVVRGLVGDGPPRSQFSDDRGGVGQTTYEALRTDGGASCPRQRVNKRKRSERHTHTHLQNIRTKTDLILTLYDPVIRATSTSAAALNIRRQFSVKFPKPTLICS